MNLIQKINPDKAQREMDRVNSQEEFDEMLLNMEIPEEPMQTPKQSFLEMEVQ